MGIGLGSIPRYAIYRQRKVRIVDYDPGLLFPFKILDGTTYRFAGRPALRFLPDKNKKS